MKLTNFLAALCFTTLALAVPELQPLENRQGE